jgi:ABC-type lipoprotein export system ATPase subunit
MKILGAPNDAGRTIVVITHEAEIAQFTQRVVWMRDGHIDGGPGAAEPDGGRHVKLPTTLLSRS